MDKSINKINWKGQKTMSLIMKIYDPRWKKLGLVFNKILTGF